MPSRNALSFRRRCPDGFWSDVMATSCQPCPVGTFRNSWDPITSLTLDNPANSKCYKCPAGTYASSEGSSVCLPCPAGTYTSTLGSAACAKCAAGTSSLTGTRAQQLDKAGNTAIYTLRNDVTGRALMVEGVDKYYWLAARDTACEITLPGFYAPEEGVSVQLPCRPGTFMGNGGTADDHKNCLTCPLGTFQHEFGQREWCVS